MKKIFVLMLLFVHIHASESPGTKMFDWLERVIKNTLTPEEQKLCVRDIAHYIRSLGLASDPDNGMLCQQHPLLLRLQALQEKQSTKAQQEFFELLEALVKFPARACALFKEIVQVIRLRSEQYFCKTLNDMVLIVDDVQFRGTEKKIKKRLCAAAVFGSLAQSCLQFTPLAALVGAKHRTILNIFGLAFSSMARVVESDENEPCQGEATDELQTHMALLAKIMRDLKETEDSQSTLPTKQIDYNEVGLYGCLVQQQLLDEVRKLFSDVEELLEKQNEGDPEMLH